MFLFTFVQKQELRDCSLRQRDKIDFLRSNQHLGHEPITSDIKSNCWGTAAHLVDGEEFVADVWLEYLEMKMFDVDDQVCLPRDCNRPGYVGRWPMSRFLQEKTISVKKERCKGGIVAFHIPVAFYGEKEKMLRERYGESVLLHSGIYLGSLYSDLMFHQNGHGGRFEIASVKGFANRYEKNFSYPVDVDYRIPL